VRFHAEHHFNGSVGAVAAILSESSFYLDLVLPDLSQPELLEQQDLGDGTELRLRYEFVGSLDPIAQRLIGAGRLAWVQSVRIDRSTGSGSLQFEAEKDPRRLHGKADFDITTSDRGCERRLEGELIVAVPGVGRMAERRIVPGLLRRLDIEAEAVNQRLRSG
jgi:hypothetical protein